MRRTSSLAVVLLIVIVAGCAGRKTRTARPAPVGAPTASAGELPVDIPNDASARSPQPETPSGDAAQTAAEEEGLASWYGDPYHGRRTSSGEVYDMEDMTAAHRTLPFETWVRVHNLDNDRTADVRINDRGPFIDGRIIDLSRAAARMLGVLGPGTAKVRIQVIPPPLEEASVRRTASPPINSSVSPVSPFDAKPAPPFPRWGVQVGAFREKEKAELALEEWKVRYPTAQLLYFENELAAWKVVLGDFASNEEAADLVDRLRAQGTKSFVVDLNGPFVSAQ